MPDLDLFNISTTASFIRAEVVVRTEALLEKHTFEEDVLVLFTFVPNTYLLIQRAKSRLNQVHGSHPIWSKTNTSAEIRSDRYVQASEL